MSSIDVLMCKPVYVGRLFIDLVEFDDVGYLKDGIYVGKEKNLVLATNSATIEKFLKKGTPPREIIAYFPMDLPKKDDTFVDFYMELIKFGFESNSILNLYIKDNGENSGFIEAYDKRNNNNPLKFIDVLMKNEKRLGLYHSELEIAKTLRGNYNDKSEFIEAELYKRMVRERTDF